MHNFRLWLYLVCGLTLASISHAQTATVYPVGVNSASINSSGQVVSMQTFRATYAGQPDSYYSRAVAYNKATTGKLGKARAFVKGNALNLGIVAATLAIGWGLDEILKDVYITQGQSYSCGNATTTACLNIYGGAVGGSYNDCQLNALHCYSNQALAISAVQAKHNAIQWQAGRVPFTCSLNGGASPNWTIKCIGANGYQATLVNMNINSHSGTATQTTPAVKPTDEQMHNSLFPQPMWENNGYLGDNLPELLRDPVTGATELTQEVQDVATQVQNEVTAMHNPTATPVTAPTVDPNFTSTTNNPAPTGMPAFCGWASAVCDFMNWFKTDTTEEPTLDVLPQENLTYETPEWSSGLGSGSCPSPNTISVLGGSFEISYQPFCTLAEMLKYLVLALAYITSAMIISGVRK